MQSLINILRNTLYLRSLLFCAVFSKFLMEDESICSTSQSSSFCSLFLVIVIFCFSSLNLHQQPSSSSSWCFQSMNLENRLRATSKPLLNSTPRIISLRQSIFKPFCIKSKAWNILRNTCLPILSNFSSDAEKLLRASPSILFLHFLLLATCHQQTSQCVCECICLCVCHYCLCLCNCKSHCNSDLIEKLAACRQPTSFRQTFSAFSPIYHPPILLLVLLVWQQLRSQWLQYCANIPLH